MIHPESGVSELPLSPGVELKTDTTNAVHSAIASVSPSTATHRNLQGTANATIPPRQKGVRPVSTNQVNVSTAGVY
jgi:hypothetical protein